MRDTDDPPRLPGAPGRRTWWEGASWGDAATAVALGITTVLLVRVPIGAGVVVLWISVLGVVVAIARPVRSSIPFLVVAGVLAGVLAIRASAPLALLDIGAAVALTAWGVSFAREGRPDRTGLRGYAVRMVAPLQVVPDAMRGLVAPVARAAAGTSHGRHLPRVIAIVVPVVAVFLFLLASADAVFAHYLEVAVGVVPTIDRLPRHVALFVTGTIVTATLWERARRPMRTALPPPPTRSFLRRADWVALLAAVDLVFLAFVLVQATAFFGGRTHVLSEQGLTFAEYARTGFAQLLVASILTSLLVGTVWFGGRPSGTVDQAVFAWLAGSLVVLTLVVLVSAFRRLTLYESAFGWTWPRLLGHATVVFLGASLVAGLVWIVVRKGSWLPTAVLIAAVAVLLGLNAMDPDRFIAERNLERFEATGLLDVSELTGLSADAAPTLVAALGSLRPTDARILAHDLACERDALAADRDVRSWNLGRWRGLDALEAADLGPC